VSAVGKFDRVVNGDQVADGLAPDEPERRRP